MKDNLILLKKLINIKLEKKINIEDLVAWIIKYLIDNSL